MPSHIVKGLYGSVRHFNGQPRPEKRTSVARGASREATENTAKRDAAFNAEQAERDRQKIRRMHTSGAEPDEGWADIDIDDVMEQLAAEDASEARERDEEGRAVVEEMMAELRRYRIGVGMEYFEGCEAWFSKSNNLASITRTASRFHRQQAIVQYVQHANAVDAYGGLDNSLRGQISKALQRRHQAIQNRFRTFNKCALALSLSTISEENLANENFVAELALLRPSRINISDQPWSKPGSPARQAMDLDFKLKRADEEINRLNIEIRRFWTWMEDESKFLRRYEEHLGSTGNPSLAFHIRLQRIARERFDAEHRRRLCKLLEIGLDAAVLQCGTSVDRSRHEAPVTRPIGAAVEEPAEQDADVSMSDEDVDEDDVAEEAIADGIAAVVAAASQ
ncbi:hypothetical protein HMN09_00352600 [Mycena chlorophos]|uniref:Uncharacterized protein n=1 Tax=Mycena chlorophos TaxID=658473 RepID=A0A8H6WH43_MYCCL|nr:hypothetical protein HMN09_00352600 [Mycena chlorophos]